MRDDQVKRDMASHQQRAGDLGTFAELFEQYKNLVYKTAYLLLNDAVQAEEALQEVFVLVFKSLSSFDRQKGAFTTWLYRITVNYCLSQRRRHRLSLQPLDRDHGLGAIEPGVASLAEREAVRQAISRLSDKQRSVVILRFYWDLPYAQVAQILDIPVGTVKSRIDLALRTLRRDLAQDQVNEVLESSSQGSASREECRP